MQAVSNPLPSIASGTWPKGRANADVDLALEDFVNTLSALNVEVNGEKPSSIESIHVTDLPRPVVHSITEIIVMLRECEVQAANTPDNDWFARAAWRAETAWSAVLAGDIDDIEQHLNDEERMRFE